MPIPLIVWGGVAIAGALGVGYAASETGEAVHEVGDTSLKVNKLLKTTAIVGVGYLAYKHRKDIAALVGKGK